MNRNDLHNSISTLIALALTAISTNTSTVGAIIDRQGSGALEFLLLLGAFTDGTYTPLIEHGDESDLSDAAAVDDAELLGTEASAALTAAGVSKIGYAGNKRYVRLTIVSTGVTTGATIGATAVKSALRYEGTTG